MCTQFVEKKNDVRSFCGYWVADSHFYNLADSLFLERPCFVMFYGLNDFLFLSL